MTPTLEQIEAAAKAIAERWDVDLDMILLECRIEYLEAAKAALTAAAEVVEGTAATRRQLIDGTIERCAQVAEGFGWSDSPQIAAAIRAKKEKP